MLSKWIFQLAIKHDWFIVFYKKDSHSQVAGIVGVSTALFHSLYHFIIPNVYFHNKMW